MPWAERRTHLRRPRGVAPRRPDLGAPGLPEVSVVEGDASVRASLVWLLESLGIGVAAFASTAEFLRGVEAAHGCVIVDVELRGVDRLATFIAGLRQRGLGLPIIATSADPFVSPEEVQRAGAIGFLPKPFSSQALVDCLRAAASRSAALAS